MSYTNKCPISFEPLVKEKAFLIKVPKSDNKTKDIYYYTGNEKTLKELSSCPFSRRQGNYYAIKLSEKTLDDCKDMAPQDIASKLLKSDNNDTLVEDNDVLSKIDKENKFNWQLRKFKNKASNNQYETNNQDLLDFTDNQTSENPFFPILLDREPSNENSISSPTILDRASLSINRQLISNYRANFLRHPTPQIAIFESIINRNQFVRYGRVITELLNNALEEHDLVFLFHAYLLISKLDDSRAKTALQNAVYNQLVKYIAGFLVLTNTISIAIDLFNNGFSSSTCFGILKVLLIDRAQDSLELLFKESSRPRANSIFSSIFIDGPKQLTNPSKVYESAKSATANAYEFAKTNVSFFYNKFIKAEPVQYELPEDLANAQESLARFMGR
ncbi:hypothetical protein ACQUW5_00745 [Legionella sp. CNM-1927-20]|uniref:hypothetical protein n=1 Tax=Legionella sp. CNM-1927-20 TaxID=3422221 RepID=UPI00403B150D